MMNINLDDIQVHADVIDSTGHSVGKVDHLEGTDQIKLTKHDATDGKHHLIPVSWVKEVNDKHIVLNKSFEEIRQQWTSL